MPTIEEKRIYGDRERATEVYVAAGTGLVVVSVSGDLVGEFSLHHRGTVRDVAVAPAGPGLAVATPEDVLTGDFTPAGFGPAVAVGADADGRLVAAGEDGRVARFDAGDWETLGYVADVRSIDGRLLAAAGGVHRLDDGLPAAGLTDAFDVAGRDVPFAATAEGLYRLGNGWLVRVRGSFRAVAADSDRVHAATADAIHERTGDGWRRRAVPADDPLADVAHARGALLAVTEPGELFVDAGDGWRSRSLGVREVRRLAVRG